MQSRLASAIEVAAGTAFGYAVSLAVQAAVFPLYGIDMPAGQQVSLSAIFTAVSLVRGYAVRRAFNAFHVTSWAQLGALVRAKLTP